jgi:glycosyltransferase involved in cell wall biosynthesis
MKQKASSSVCFLGYITNSEILAELYHHCFVYLHGHEFGGTNPTMLKAMAYGCAILALDTVFNREMLQEGKYGLFFQKDPESMGLQIQQIEKNPALLDTLRELSRSGLTDKYNWDVVTKQYLDVMSALKQGKK